MEETNGEENKRRILRKWKRRRRSRDIYWQFLTSCDPVTFQPLAANYPFVETPVSNFFEDYAKNPFFWLHRCRY